MPEIHLRQPGFTYRPYIRFTKNRETIQKSLKKQDIHDIFIKTN